MQQFHLSLVVSVVFLSLSAIDAARKGRGLRTQPRIPNRTASSGDGNEVVVSLTRLPARSVKNAEHADASFYVGNMTVGDPPQEFQVLFDTGSGHVLLPHKACKTKVCSEHHQYSPWASSTSEDVNDDGAPVQEGHRLAKGAVNRSFASLQFTQADLGEGVAKGVLVKDHVCLSSGPEGHRGHQACADLALLTATDEDAMPFEAMPADGIIGLGLEGLSVSALSSFYAGLMDSAHNLLPEFGISLGADGGKITFGGRAAIANLAGPLEWFPVHRPQDGMWQVEIMSVRVGGIVVDSCSGTCHAIVDTSASRVGVQGTKALTNLRDSLAAYPEGSSCMGPELQFELPRGMVVTLSAEDYSSKSCEAQVGSLNLDGPSFKGVYSFGTNVLRRYYAAFDWASAQLGFAPHAGSPPLHSLARKNHHESVGSSSESITV